MNIFIFIVACLYIAFNIVTSKLLTAKEMKSRFINGQNIVGKIATNIFYSPAWLLKFLKITIIKSVK